MCGLAVQWMNRESQIGGHRFDLGLSQSRETDNRQVADRLPRQQASRIPIRDSNSPNSRIWDDSPDPKSAQGWFSFDQPPNKKSNEDIWRLLVSHWSQWGAPSFSQIQKEG